MSYAVYWLVGIWPFCVFYSHSLQRNRIMARSRRSFYYNVNGIPRGKMLCVWNCLRFGFFVSCQTHSYRTVVVLFNPSSSSSSSSSHVAARISLTLSFHPSLSFIVSGMFSKLNPVSAQS